jgi:hypothetical protein
LVGISSSTPTRREMYGRAWRPVEVRQVGMFGVGVEGI